MRKHVALLALAGGIPFAAAGQTVINGARQIAGAWDAGDAASTRPAKTGTVLPATCAAGSQFFKTDAPAGQNLYFCTAANTWTQMTGSGGAAASPLTTKGDLFGHSNVDVRIPVGSDGQVLTADSTQAAGVKWAAAGVSLSVTTKGDLQGFTTAPARIAAGADDTVLAASSAAAAGVAYKTVKFRHAETLPFSGESSGSTGYPAGGVGVPGSNGPTFQYQGADPYRYPQAYFAKAASDLTINVSTTISPDWDGGAMSLWMRRFSGSGTANTAIVWQVRAACMVDGVSMFNPPWPGAWTTVTDTVGGNDETKTVSFGDFARGTGCAGGANMVIQLRRATTSGSDTWAGAAYTPALVLVYKVKATLE
jgi:hypothetical protein